MLELQELSQNDFHKLRKIQDINKIYAAAKTNIVQEMMRQEKSEVARAYVEKTMRSFGGNEQFLVSFLKKVAKIKGMGKNWMTGMVLKAALKVHDPKIERNIDVYQE